MKFQQYVNENAKLFFSNALFSQYLCFEAFDTNVELTICKDMDFCRKFNYDNNEYLFTASKLVNDEYDVYVIGLREINTDIFSDNDKEYLPKKGDKYPGKFYAALLKCIKELIKEKSVDILAFKTFDDKLEKLYDNMHKYFSKILKGYKLIRQNKEFVYTRVNI